MIKTVEVIVIIALIIFSFFLGVKYSDSVKSHMSWLENQDEQEIELPDLSNEPATDSSAPNIDIIDNSNEVPNPASPQVAPVATTPEIATPTGAAVAPTPEVAPATQAVPAPTQANPAPVAPKNTKN